MAVRSSSIVAVDFFKGITREVEFLLAEMERFYTAKALEKQALVGPHPKLRARTG